LNWGVCEDKIDPKKKKRILAREREWGGNDQYSSVSRLQKSEGAGKEDG